MSHGTSVGICGSCGTNLVVNSAYEACCSCGQSRVVFGSPASFTDKPAPPRLRLVKDEDEDDE